MDLKLTPSKELGRPRINIMVQVSGQLRDIASSRLKMLTDAVTLAANSKDDVYPNFVAQGSEELESHHNVLENYRI
jgi:cobaltochelatase CobN